MNKPASEAAQKIHAIVKEYNLACVIVLEQENEAPVKGAPDVTYTGESIISVTPSWSCLKREGDSTKLRKGASAEEAYQTLRYLSTIAVQIMEQGSIIEELGIMISNAYPQVMERVVKEAMEAAGIDPRHGRN